MPAPPHTSPAALNNLFYTGPAPAAPRAATPPAARPVARPNAPAPAPRPAAPVSHDVHKLRNEIIRLEMLVKRLQAELEAKNQYCTALEAHIKSQQDSESPLRLPHAPRRPFAHLLCSLGNCPARMLDPSWEHALTLIHLSESGGSRILGAFFQGV